MGAVEVLVDLWVIQGPRYHLGEKQVTIQSELVSQPMMTTILRRAAGSGVLLVKYIHSGMVWHATPKKKDNSGVKRGKFADGW
jgi:hypothetical protein